MIEDEISKIPELQGVGLALVEFSRSLFPGTKFTTNAQGRHVASPDNFVTFTVHWQRAKNITVTLRGNPEEFLPFSELQLQPDMAGYSSFRLTRVDQLAAAAFFVRDAAELYRAGRVRSQRGQKVVES